jgi:putative acetyltransferase
MHIRTATDFDGDAIRSIHLAAFADEEKEIVSELAVNLLHEDTTPPTISLVAESPGRVVGHVAFSPVKIGSDDAMQGYILAPLAVLPEYQNQRVGSKLIEAGQQRLLQQGVQVLFVYGDPHYYGRFGFSTDGAALYDAPYTLQYPFGWQALPLNRGGSPESPVTITCVASLSDPQLW